MEDKDYNYKIYTPYEFAQRMVAKSLDEYFKNDFTVEKLEGLRITDLSCGTGNLILVALEELIKYSKKIYGEYQYNSNWIIGYDIDEDALNICKKRSEEIFSKYNLENVSIELICCDSLYLELNKKYDIVLGNPPYLGEKNNKEIFQRIKSTEFGKKYYESKMDYLYFFIEKGINLLKKDGILAYITTNYWLKADSAAKLRKELKDKGKFFKIELYDFSLFKNAVGQHNIIFYWKKDGIEDGIEIFEERISFVGKNSEIYNENGKIILAPEEIMRLNSNINNKKNYYLGDILNINQGIVTGLDKAFIFEEFNEKFKKYLKPFYKSKDIGKYINSKIPPFWILYLNGDTQIDEEVKEYLEKYREELSKRREVKTGKINWWELQWARDSEIFQKPKIVVRQRCKSNNFSYTEEIFYGSADIYYMTEKKEDINLFYILGYLNSKIFYIWFKYNGKIKGKNLEFYSTPLKETPIYYPENKEERIYIEKLVKKQIEGYDEEIQKEIDEYFYNVFTD